MCYIEIDYADVVARKTKIIKETPLLSAQISNLATDGPINTPEYKLFACDVRDIASIEA